MDIQENKQVVLIDALRDSLDVSRQTYDSGLRRDDVLRMLIAKLEHALQQVEAD